MNSIILKKYWIHYLWLFIIIYPIFSLNLGLPSLGNVIFILMFSISIGAWRFIKKTKSHCIRYTHKYYTYLYIYNIILFLIGFFFIPNILYLKFYISFFINILLFSVFYYFNYNPYFVIDFIQKIFKYALPLYTLLLLCLFLNSSIRYNIYYLSLFTVLYLFVPLSNRKLICLLITFSLLSVIFNVDFRALLVLNVVGLFILSLRFINIPIKIVKFSTYFFLFIPLLIIIISVLTGWNPFTILDNSSAQSISLAGEKIVISGDSRSFLFKEIYNHLCKYNALIWGTTPGIGYQSVLMNVDTDFYDLLKDGRLHTEVGILEFFHFGGFINVLLVFSVFFGSIITIFKLSKNRITYYAALYLSLRWFFLFMEGDITMTVQWLGLFVVLAFFTNKEILSLTDKQIDSIFNKHFK